MGVLIFILILYILLGVSLMKVFEKAGVPGWKALVPGVAAVEWCKIVGRKPGFAAWLLFPIVNIFIYAGLAVDMVRSFGKHSFWDAALAVIYAPISFFMIGASKTAKYEGPILDKEREYHQQLHEATEKKDKLALKKLEANTVFKKPAVREWAEAIIFAVFAAAFIRMFLIEAFVIPTSSMEGTLKVGDFLFVSKAHYGIRTPMTVVQFPLVHNRFSQDMDGALARESYLKKPALPYFRLPALENIDRNKPIVFNFPAGDSVILTPGRTFDIYQALRVGAQRVAPDKIRMRYLDPKTHRAATGNFEIVTRPIDKKDHYIKRCIALPGDSLVIRNKQVFINGLAAQNPTHMQFAYQIFGNISASKLDELGVSLPDHATSSDGAYFLDEQQLEKVKALGMKVEPVIHDAQPGYFFPYDTAHSAWTVDDFGPIWVPKAGETTPLTASNIAFYERIIRVYEGNELVIKNGKFIINGQETTTYTFKQNYYWCMGDNRHNSEDCRVWGYVPEDHVVGKPLFIWFSTKNGNMAEGINWNRIFKSASTL